MIEMQKLEEKKTIYVVPKDSKNWSLFRYIINKYGSLYKVDFLHGKREMEALGRDGGFDGEPIDPDKVALVVIPGYSGDDWNPSERVLGSYIDYLEAGGNLLLVCDAVLSFVKKRAVVYPDDSGELIEDCFSKGPSRLPNALICAKLRTEEARNDHYTHSIIGPYFFDVEEERAPRFRHTGFYRDNSFCIALEAGYDTNTILPISRVHESCKSYPFGHRDKDEMPLAFNMLYVKQGKGNLVLSLDHNEEAPSNFFWHNITLFIGLSIKFAIIGNKERAKDLMETVPHLIANAAKWLKAGGYKHSGLNSQLRRFMYEDIFGLESPREALKAPKLDPSLIAIKEQIDKMKGMEK
jgi:hypothetical protein